MRLASKLMDFLFGKSNSRLDRELEATTTELSEAKARQREALGGTQGALEDLMRANDELQVSFVSYRPTPRSHH